MNEGDCPVLPGSDQWEAGREHQCNAINSAICYSWVAGRCKRHQWKLPLPQREVFRQLFSIHEGSGQSWHVMLLVGLCHGGANLGRDTCEGWDCCGNIPMVESLRRVAMPWLSDVYLPHGTSTVLWTSVPWWVHLHCFCRHWHSTFGIIYDEVPAAKVLNTEAPWKVTGHCFLLCRELCEPQQQKQRNKRCPHRKAVAQKLPCYF